MTVSSAWSFLLNPPNATPPPSTNMVSYTGLLTTFNYHEALIRPYFLAGWHWISMVFSSTQNLHWQPVSKKKMRRQSKTTSDFHIWIHVFGVLCGDVVKRSFWWLIAFPSLVLIYMTPGKFQTNPPYNLTGKKNKSNNHFFEAGEVYLWKKAARVFK